MELGLSLGDSSRPNFIGLMEKGSEGSSNNQQLGLGFNTTLSIGPIITVQKDQQEEQEEEAKAKKENSNNQRSEDHHEGTNNGFHQLDLLPKLSFPWHPPSQNGTVLSSDIGANYSRGLDVNVLPVATVVAAAEEEGEALSSSPSASSFQMELCMYSRGGSGSGKRENSDEAYEQSCHQRASDEDDNGGNTRKKLRLSKEQSAFLEESFKEHHTLNPKQKLALARQLNLRPRQVEVWFQNRRARTKLKQTEVDCEYLKRCCETLTEENRRLHKELQELRALKSTSNSNPFYMQLPATTLTMCPSCERVATNNSTSTITTATTSTSTISNIAPTPKTLNNGNENSNSNSKAIGFPFGNKPIFHPFGNSTSQPQPHQSTPSILINGSSNEGHAFQDKYIE